MRSVVPSESATVPLPDHAPSKPANGPDWAWPADTDNRSAAPTPAALIACARNLTPSFISNFPIQINVLIQETSRRIEDLVSPQCARFKWQTDGWLQLRRPTHLDPGKYPNRSTSANGIFRSANSK